METEGFHPDQVDRFGKPWPAVKITGARYGVHNRRMRSGLCKYLCKGIDPKDLAYTGYGARVRCLAPLASGRGAMLPRSKTNAPAQLTP